MNIKKIAWASSQPGSRSANSSVQDQINNLQTDILGLLQLHQVVMEGKGNFAVHYRKKYADRDTEFKHYLDQLQTWRQATPDAQLESDLQILNSQIQGDQVRLESLFFQAAAHSAHTHNYLKGEMADMGYPMFKLLADAALRELEVLQLQIRQMLDASEGDMDTAAATQIISLYNLQSQYELDIVNAVQEDREKAEEVEQYMTVTAVLVLVLVLIILIKLAWFDAKGSWIMLKEYTLLGIPAGVLVWSLIGSIAAMIHRYYKGNAHAFSGPFKWSVIRPTMGIFTASVVYMALHALFVREGETFHPYVALLLAFFVGYSDKFSMSLMQSIQDVLSTIFKKEDDASRGELNSPTPQPPTPQPDPPAPTEQSVTEQPAADQGVPLPQKPKVKGKNSKGELHSPATPPTTPIAEEDPNAGEDEA